MKNLRTIRFFCLLIFMLGIMQLSVQAVRSANEPAPDERVKLYVGDPPGKLVQEPKFLPMEVTQRGRYQSVHEPVLDFYHAKGDNPTGAAVVICPGGGYGSLAYNHEGIQVAQFLSEHGITGIVLRYRMKPYRHPIPMMDVQRAMQTVRANAKQWSIDPERIGILGFSAGGHLASTATVHQIDADPESDDPVLRVSSRPDFAVLVYPVITMGPEHVHTGSRENLLGLKPTDELLDMMSTHKQVTERNPPTLLVHSKDDQSVPIENSLLFLDALKAKWVNCRLVTYETGGHGYGLAKSEDHETAAWPGECLKWLDDIGVLD